MVYASNEGGSSGPKPSDQYGQATWGVMPTSSGWGDLWSTAGSGSSSSGKPGYDGVSMPKVTDPMTAAKGGGSVFDWILDTFKQYGMGDVGKDALAAIRNSRSPEEAIMAIRDTDSYKTRFAGNVARIKAGFGALDEGQYLAMESQYRQTMRAAGLPKGFYDDPSDLAGFIGGDVSVAEIGERASKAMELVNSKDPNELKAFRDYYGISKGDLAAYFLDPAKALPILQKQVAAAELGAEATRAGLSASAGFSESLVDKGISQEQARQAYGDVAYDKDTLAKLATMSGTSVGINDVVEAKLGLDTKTEKKVVGLVKREASRFGGRSGGTLALGGNSAGSF